jgi:1-acyl-sn-glycerol-3-phosphate acyltransferase
VGKYRNLNGPAGWAYRLSASVVKPFLLATTTTDWRGGERIPHEGGVILAMNHVSEIDPLTAAHITWDYGRLSRYLAKKSLFRVKGLGTIMRAAGQIPVDRGAGLGALSEAIDAVDSGELIVVYIEGSITKDPTGWPMKGKTGAARIALATGAPVIPVGQWGAQELLPAYARSLHLKGGRKKVSMYVGEPVDLAGLSVDSMADIQEATDRIMKAIVAQVEEIRGEPAPLERFDPAAHGLKSTGNPNAKKKV